MSERPRRIQLRRTKGWLKPDNTVVVARPGRWGNPFTVWRDDYSNTGPRWVVSHGATHEEQPNRAAAQRLAVRLYELWTKGDRHGTAAAARYHLDAMLHLRGRNLACWCRLCPAHVDGKPLGTACDACAPCHADVLLELANAPLRCEAV